MERLIVRSPDAGDKGTKCGAGYLRKQVQRNVADTALTRNAFADCLVSAVLHSPTAEVSLGQAEGFDLVVDPRLPKEDCL